MIEIPFLARYGFAKNHLPHISSDGEAEDELVGLRRVAHVKGAYRIGSKCGIGNMRR